MTIVRPLSNQALSIEERTGEIVIVFARDSEAAIKILRQRMIIDAAGTHLAQTQNYVLGRWLAADILEQQVEIAGKQISVGDVIATLGVLADRWADEDVPIYGAANYLKPIT
jgi:hypothetical protein